MFVTGIDTGVSNSWATLMFQPGQRPQYVDCATCTYEELIAAISSGTFGGHLIGVERSTGFYASDAKKKSGGAKLASTAADLLDAAYIAGEVHGRILQAGGRSYLVPVSEARKAAGVRFGAQRGRSGVSAEETVDQQIARIIPTIVAGWPAPRKTNNHERDAGIAGLYVARYAAVHS